MSDKRNLKNFPQLMHFLRTNSEINQQAYERLTAVGSRQKLVSDAAKAITLFAFRNGPVETMHSNGKLNQEDMKTLNKFTADKLALVFDLIFNNRWAELEILIGTYEGRCDHWDKPVPSSEPIEQVVKFVINTKP